MNIQFSPIQKLLVCFLIYLAGCQSPSQLPSPDPDNGGLFLPDGFEALVVADSVGRARHLAINDNGDIYIKLTRKIHRVARLFGHKVLSLSELRKKQHFINSPKYEE